MLVCHCHGVSDRAIRAAVREGATCRGHVTRACSAGRSCGGCAPMIDQIIRAESDDTSAPASTAALIRLPELARAS